MLLQSALRETAWCVDDGQSRHTAIAQANFASSDRANIPAQRLRGSSITINEVQADRSVGNPMGKVMQYGNIEFCGPVQE